jgi:hypothetical protein
MQTAQEQQQIRDQVRQSVQDARDAARDAAQAARDAGSNTRVIRIGPQPPLPPGAPIIIQRGGGNGFVPGDIPPGVKEVAMGFFFMCTLIVIGFPLARAFGRRIERRAPDVAPPNLQMADQLQRIEQAVDAMAIEIERISESQRFIAKLQNQGAERSALPADRG